MGLVQRIKLASLLRLSKATLRLSGAVHRLGYAVLRLHHALMCRWLLLSHRLVYPSLHIDIAIETSLPAKTLSGLLDRLLNRKLCPVEQALALGRRRLSSGHLTCHGLLERVLSDRDVVKYSRLSSRLLLRGRLLIPGGGSGLHLGREGVDRGLGPSFGLEGSIDRVLCERHRHARRDRRFLIVD